MARLFVAHPSTVPGDGPLDGPSRVSKSHRPCVTEPTKTATDTGVLLSESVGPREKLVYLFGKYLPSALPQASFSFSEVCRILCHLVLKAGVSQAIYLPATVQGSEPAGHANFPVPIAQMRHLKLTAQNPLYKAIQLAAAPGL